MLNINALFGEMLFFLFLFCLCGMKCRFWLISRICSHRHLPGVTNTDVRSATMGGVLLNFPFISFDLDTCIRDGISLRSSWQWERKWQSYQTSWKSFFPKENKDTLRLSDGPLHSASHSVLQPEFVSRYPEGMVVLWQKPTLYPYLLTALQSSNSPWDCALADSTT